MTADTFAMIEAGPSKRIGGRSIMHDRRMRQSRQAGTVFAADVGGSFIRLARSVHPGHIELLEKLPTLQTAGDFRGALNCASNPRIG